MFNLTINCYTFAGILCLCLVYFQSDQQPLLAFINPFLLASEDLRKTLWQKENYFRRFSSFAIMYNIQRYSIIILYSTDLTYFCLDVSKVVCCRFVVCGQGLTYFFITNCCGFLSTMKINCYTLQYNQIKFYLHLSITWYTSIRLLVII